MLKDFATNSDFSDWFSRDDGDDALKAKVVLKPNPRNAEMDDKLASLQSKIDRYACPRPPDGASEEGLGLTGPTRLRLEKETWLSMKKPPPEEPPLFAPDEAPDQVVLPDFDLLDPDDGSIRGFLGDEANSFAALRAATAARLRTIQESLEFEVDQLADNVHKLRQRVLVAGKEADSVLRLGAVRLREREEREKTSAGTRDMPIMEVLRSLSSILPEGNGG